jgi:DegV family protein with EDD domain
MTIRIVTDSTCDLPGQTAALHGISVVPMYINFGNESYLDGVEITRADFYARIVQSKVHPTTSAPGPAAFIQTYDRLAAEGATEVISIHLAESLSNVVQVARLAAQDTRSVPVTVVDGGQVTLGTGLLVLTAAEAAAQGADSAAILDLLQDRMARTHTFAALDTLEFLRRSGRLSRLQSSLGSWLQLKPILKMHRGVADLERIRTRSQAAKRLIELATDLAPLQRIAFLHTNAAGRLAQFRTQAAHLVPAGESPLEGEVTPIIGSHVGPGAIGLVCISAA